MARHFGHGGRQWFRSKIEQPEDNDFTVTLRTSGAVGLNLAASTTYSYALSYTMYDGSETTPSAAKSVTTGLTPYPIDLAFSEVEDDMPGEANGISIYRNGVKLTTVSRGTISFVDDGNVAPTTTAPKAANDTSYAVMNYSKDRLVIPVGTNKYAT